MIEIRKMAKQLHKDGKNAESKDIYDKLWDECNGKEIDIWLGWEYADTLKKLGYLDRAISICKLVYKKDSTFKYNNDLLSWCLYEKYFKELDIRELPKNSNQLIKIGNFITYIISQDPKLPYEKIIWKIIKMHKNPFNASLIINWLNKLDVNLLSENPIIINVESKNVELASSKEEWYYLKSKALNKLCKYKECIKLCDEAISCIKKFHNNRDIWMQKEKAECLAKLGWEEEAINLLKIVLIKNGHWTIYDSLFQIQIELQNYDEGLMNAYIAALSKDPPKIKVKLYYDIGRVLELKAEYKLALMHYLFCKKIRIENRWNVSNDLMSKIKKLSIKEPLDENKLFVNLKKFWLSEKLKNSERIEGTIFKLMPKGKCGFIKSKNGSFYFKNISILMSKKHLQEGMKVTFSLIDSFDKRKNVNTKEAVDILLL